MHALIAYHKTGKICEMVAFTFDHISGTVE